MLSSQKLRWKILIYKSTTLLTPLDRNVYIYIYTGRLTSSFIIIDCFVRKNLPEL